MLEMPADQTVGLYSIDMTSELEVEQASRFGTWLTGSAPVYQGQLEHDRWPRRSGKLPDFLLSVPNGDRFVLELTRLLLPDVRRLHDVLVRLVCSEFQRTGSRHFYAHITPTCTKGGSTEIGRGSTPAGDRGSFVVRVYAAPA